MDRPTKTSNLGTSFWQIPYSTKVFVMENKVHGSFFLIRCIVSFFLSSKSFGVWRNAKSSPVLQDTASSLSELNFPNPSHLSGDGCVFVIHYHRNNFLCARLRTVKALATPRGASLWHDFAFVVSITNRFILMLLNIPARSRVDDLMVRMSASWLWVAAIFPLGWLILSNNQSIATQWVLDTCLHLDHRKRQELVVAPNLLKWSGLSHLIATRFRRNSGHHVVRSVGWTRPLLECPWRVHKCVTWPRGVKQHSTRILFVSFLKQSVHCCALKLFAWPKNLLKGVSSFSSMPLHRKVRAIRNSGATNSSCALIQGSTCRWFFHARTEFSFSTVNVRDRVVCRSVTLLRVVEDASSVTQAETAATVEAVKAICSLVRSGQVFFELNGDLFEEWEKHKKDEDQEEGHGGQTQQKPWRQKKSRF